MLCIGTKMLTYVVYAPFFRRHTPCARNPDLDFEISYREESVATVSPSRRVRLLGIPW